MKIITETLKKPSPAVDLKDSRFVHLKLELAISQIIISHDQAMSFF